MRPTDDKIKEAILHPEAEVRLVAVSYFTGSHSQDPTVMPLVVEAVRKYGREAAFFLLRRAEGLAQTDATVDWLIDELARDYDIEDVAEDNYHCAVALILCGADPDLLASRRSRIAASPHFPEELRERLDRRLEMRSWDWATGWAALEELATSAMREDEFSRRDFAAAEDIIEALARSGREQTELVLRMVDYDFGDMDPDLIVWMDLFVIDLAGAMRLEEAMPTLVEGLHETDIDLADACVSALGRIGGDEVVRALADEWPDAGTDFRLSAASVLEDIPTDLSVESCLRFLADEEDDLVQFFLAGALVSQLDDRAIDSVREFLIAQEKLTLDCSDLRNRLVLASTILGVSFPEYDLWYADAVKDHWGRGNRGSFRMRDNLSQGYSDEEEGTEDFDDEWEDEDEDAWEDEEEYGDESDDEDDFPRRRSYSEEDEDEDWPAAAPIRNEERHVGRNDPCPCGSGKKFKKCCLKKQQEKPPFPLD
jgi:hypothetical protein